MPPARKSTNQKKQKGQRHSGITKKRKFYCYSLQSLKEALHEIRVNGCSIREASRRFGVPRATIQDRIHGRVEDIAKKTGPEPLLTTEGETKIVKWVKKMAKCGFPLKKSELMETAGKILKDVHQEHKVKGGKPGEKWYQGFLRRHPDIVTREAESINKARAIITEEGIRLWFVELQQFLNENNLLEIFEDPNRVLNCDEAGFQLCPKTGKVLAPKGMKNVYTVKMGNEKENVTVLMNFTASGKICPPLVVFPYVRPPKALIKSVPKTWVVGRSDSGWMKTEVFSEYICNDFIKWVDEQNIKRPIILFLDGHKSHMSIPLGEFCEANQIILYALPPNTTHILQPADVSVFRPLKQGWKDTVRKWQNQSQNVNCSVTKTNFCILLDEVLRNRDMAPSIIHGFRRCGLFPLDPNAVDYSKCVKNTIEREHHPDRDTTNEQITSEEFRTAEKVINKIEHKLYSYGLNVGVIYNEIKYLEKSQNKPNGKDMEIEETNTIVGTVVNLNDVDDIVDEGNLEIILVNEQQSVHEKIELETRLEEKDLPKIDCVVEDEAVVLNSKCMDTEENLQKVEKKVTILQNIIITDNDQPKETANINDNLIVESSEHLTVPPLVTDSSSNNEKEKENLDPFEHHLTLPPPVTLSKNNKGKVNEKLPNAISSEKWRQYYIRKENFQKEKEEKVKIRKEKQSLRPKKLVKNKKKTAKETESEQVEIIPPKIRCSNCDIELESDTEIEEDKNIGCDLCERWYHLKCTNFAKMSYIDAAASDYKCDFCH